MNYGLYYKEVEFNRHSINTVRNAISGDLDWKKGTIHGSHKSTRSSEIAWVRDMNLLSMLMLFINQPGVQK